MSSEAKLQGVAHNTMDHAVSGLSYLTPHVTEFCAAFGEGRLRLNLLPESIWLRSSVGWIVAPLSEPRQEG